MLQEFKNILENTKLVNLTDKDILYNNNVIDKNKQIKFEMCNKTYSAGGVILFLLDIEKSHNDYFQLCRKFKVKPIAISDKQSVVEEIRAYKGATVDGEFIKEIYALKKEYKIPQINDYSIIITGYNSDAKVNINNAEEFIKKGVINKNNTSILSGNSLFKMDSNQFKVFNNFDKFTAEDWNLVKIVFIDEIELEIKLKCPDLSSLKKNALFITFNDIKNNFDLFKVKLDDVKVVNYDDMISNINKIIQ